MSLMAASGAHSKGAKYSPGCADASVKPENNQTGALTDTRQQVSASARSPDKFLTPGEYADSVPPH